MQVSRKNARSIKEECLDRIIPIGERTSGTQSRSSSSTIIVSENHQGLERAAMATPNHFTVLLEGESGAE